MEQLVTDYGMEKEFAEIDMMPEFAYGVNPDIWDGLYDAEFIQ